MPKTAFGFRDAVLLEPDGSEPLVIDQELDAPPVLAGEFVPIPTFLVNVNGDPA